MGLAARPLPLPPLLTAAAADRTFGRHLWARLASPPQGRKPVLG